MLTGFAFKSAEFSDRGIRLARGDNVKRGAFEWGDKTRYWSAVTPDLARYLLEEGDVLIGMDGSRVGENWARVRANDLPCLLVQRVARLRPKTGFDRQFLWYLIANPVFVAYVKATQTGSAIPHISGGQIRAYAVPHPPLDQQIAIGRLLTTLDDKIDLNRRMNETLEAIARAIFQDWFVAFGPTRAKMEGRRPYFGPDLWSLFPDSLDSRGKPEGWRELPLDQMAEFLNGLALQKFPSTDSEDLPVIKIAELRAGGASGSDRASRAIPAQYVIEDGDVLFSWSGSLLQRLWTGGRGALNQHLFKVTSRQWPKWLHYLWVDHHLPSFQATAASKATTMGHIQRHHLSEAMTIIGSAEMMKVADELIGPIFQRIVSNSLEARTLATTRDLLLPRLLSGKLRVMDAERAIEAAA